MSSLLRWSRIASSTPFTRPNPQSVIAVSHARRASNLSAVWRGKRTEDARSRSRSPSAGSSRDRSPNRQTFASRDARERRPSPERSNQSQMRRLPTDRKHFKVKKALQKMQEQEEDEGGRKTRSKRFNSPDFGFGKKSMVWELNNGQFKDKIASLVDTRTAKQRQTPTDRPKQRPGERPRERSRQQSDSRLKTSEEFYAAMNEEPLTTGSSSLTNAQAAERRMSSRDSREASRTPFSPRVRDRDHVRRQAREELSDEPREPSRGRGRYGDRNRANFRQSDENPDRRRFKERDEDSFAKPDASFSPNLSLSTAASQFLFGRWPVVAALKEAKRKLYKLYVYAGSNKAEASSSVQALAKKRGVRVEIIPESKQHVLDNASKGRPHNGVVLEVSPLPQLPLTGLGPVTEDGYTVEIAHQMREDANVNGTEPFQRWSSHGGHKPLVILLHEVMDPGNLGAMLRTARFLGAAAVAITKQTSSALTPTVLKAAAGAAEELTLFSVSEPLEFLESSQKAGWESYVAVAPDSHRNSPIKVTADDIAEEDPLRRTPCILVLGNEGEGLSRKMVSKADRHITILPQPSAGGSSVDSLNVSVAAALLCDAFTKGSRAVPKSFQQKLKTDAKKSQVGESLF